MQPPAEELLALRGAVAAVFRPAHLLAPPCAGAAADGQGHGVDDEDRVARERFAQEVEQDGEPVREAMQPPIEARDGERAGEITEGAQGAERALVIGCPRILVMTVRGGW